MPSNIEFSFVSPPKKKSCLFQLVVSTPVKILKEMKPPPSLFMENGKPMILRHEKDPPQQNQRPDFVMINFLR